MKKAIIIGVVISVLIAGVAFVSMTRKPEDDGDRLARSIRAGERVEVLSLEPHWPYEDGPDVEDDKQFHGYQIKGSVKLGAESVKEVAQRRRILDAFSNAVIERPKDRAKACRFFPRHGLRVESCGRTFELVICLDCGDVDVDDERFWLDGERQRRVLRAALNSALKDAGVALADGAE
ncbi:MAG: hypothetical protein IT428_01135 [Planctomycetaceae bacterium]|nr:hypothetical protein [Planctomycetaceae bacterium]